MAPNESTPPVERTLAALAVHPPRQGWSSGAAQKALAAVADTFALGVAGLAQEQTAQALSTVAPSPVGSPLWSTADRYPVADAAFVHGVACHALDWDDYMHPMHGHVSSVLLPVVWTLAESRDLGGPELIEAFLVGYQVDYLASLVLGTAHYERGWHATSTVGTLGAAAAASHLLRLDEDQAACALALAASFASGLRVNFGTGAKAMHAGAAARHGVQAAQLAQAGVTGSPRWLLGPHGMLAAFGGELDADAAERVVRAAVDSPEHGIETAWGLVQKPYSCCGSCHAAVDGLIELSRQLTPDLAEVERIEIHVDPLVPDIMQARADSPGSARYCLPWVGAVAVAEQAAGPAQFSATALARAELHQLSQRVQIIPDLVTEDHDRFAARVALTARGSRQERTVRHASGHPANPLSAQQRTDKQYQALQPVVGDVTARELIAGLADLPSLARVAELGDRTRRAFKG